MLTVYTFGANHWPTPDPSPFCTRLLSYLTLAEIPFEQRSGMTHMRKAPKNKMPFVEYGDEVVGDSSLIIERLKIDFGDPLNEGLSAQQRATTHVISKMLTEHTYWVIVHTRWGDDSNWEAHTKPMFFGRMPLKLMAGMLRRSVHKQLQGHGMGRHSGDEIYQCGVNDFTAIATLLADNTYFFGERPSELDVTVYAFLSAVIGVPHSSPVKTFVDDHPTLKPYFSRMEQQVGLVAI